MLNRRQQPWIESDHAGQDLRVGAIGLAITLVNLAQLAGISDDHLMTAGSNETTDPS